MVKYGELVHKISRIFYWCVVANGANVCSSPSFFCETPNSAKEKDEQKEYFMFANIKLYLDTLLRHKGFETL